MVHAHFDCFSGVSGDMILGAFIDLGISEKWLMEQIAALSLGQVDLTVRDVKKHAIGAKQISVKDHTAPEVRHFSDIKKMLGNSSLKKGVVDSAIDIFRRIAEAEAKIHRCDIDSVHFHEVGAVDSIVDIVGAALCLEKYQITSISSSPLPLGSGFVDCQHGRLPVPAPATLEILKGIPVYGGDIVGERVTPTGAAILASIVQDFGTIPDMKINKIGYGSGTRETRNLPNVLRVMIGEKEDCAEYSIHDEVCVIETHIDDMNPEFFGHLMDRLFADGALDVSYTPIMMKKSRPGTKVEVICSPDNRTRLEKDLFEETSTIGLRYQRVCRHVLKRKISTVDTAYGPVQIKCTTGPDGKERCLPEYDACRRIALKNGLPLKVVYENVVKKIGIRI